MNCKKIDLNTWKRGEIFRYYINQLRVVMSLTADINVAPLLDYAKKNGLKFYPCMLWAVSKVINSHDEFRLAWTKEGDLILWDTISPSYAEFHPDDECFTRFVTEYRDDLYDFHERFMADREKYKDARGVIPNQPENYFDASCLPWIKYSNFDMHVFDEGKFLSPVVIWGKYEKTEKGIMMPLTMNIHHAAADGFHLSRFFIEVQALIDSL